VVGTGGILLALNGGPWTGWPMIVVALAWIAISTLAAVRADRRMENVGPYLGTSVALVDVGVIALALFATGGADSPVRWAVLASPTIWAYAEQRRLPLLMTFGALAYVVAALPDVLRQGAEAADTALAFLVIYAGAVAVALAAVVSRRRESVLELELARARAEMFDELVRRERRQQEDVAVRLHDGPLQMVIAAHQDLEEHLEGEDLDLRDTLSTLRLAVTALRDLNTDLYDAVLRDAGLAAALGQAAEATQRNGGPPIEVTVGAHTSSAHDPFVVSVVNELLTNVRKHADAASAAVLVARSETGWLRVSVTDDGVGLSPADADRAADAGHIGLRSIQRRVEDAGGTFHVRSLVPGTAVDLQLPEDAEVPGPELSLQRA
jgi:two-component system NarL family sensor kinase